MSESELEYQSGVLKLEHRLHNNGRLIHFKAFRVCVCLTRTGSRVCACISARKSRSIVDALSDYTTVVAVAATVADNSLSA